jgi:hypothetical protein
MLHMSDVDQYALQKSLFGGTDTEIHNKAYREELHAREKDQIPNPNVNPGQYAPKGGRNPLLKVVQHATGWTASTMLPGGKEFRVEGHDRQHAISQAIRAGEKMGHVFDPPKAEPEIGGLFHDGLFDEKQHPREHANAGLKHAGQFAPKHQAAQPAEAPFVLQRPKKNTTVPSFGSNTNTKQSALFDVGKKNELPGQELLFNSDAGDLHNPKTMENKAKPVSRESFMAQQGAANMGHSEPALHRLPGVKDNRKQQLIASQWDKSAEWQEKRDTTSAQYDEAIGRGEVREPTRIERLVTSAGGHPDNESTQAAIRLLSKTIAQEALSNNENIGITMGRHGVTIKGHPDYRTIRQQVSKHLEELQEQAKPKPSPARQRAMDAQMAKSQKPQPTPSARKTVRVFHGTHRNFDQFDRMAGYKHTKNKPKDSIDQIGIFFTNTPETAKTYYGPKVIEAEVAVEKPFVIHEGSKGEAWKKLKTLQEKKGGTETLRGWLIENGYDSVILQDAHIDGIKQTITIALNHEGISIQPLTDNKSSAFTLGSTRQPNPTDNYSHRVYGQFEEEAERYFRDYTLYDVDRYGMGGKIMRTILAFMAMHAMSKMMGKKSHGGAQQGKPAATAGSSSPSNQDFEKLHPREAVQGGNHKPGQFAKKPAGAVSQHDDPRQIDRDQQSVDMKNHNAGVKSLQPIFKKKAADQVRSDKAAERDAAKEAKANPDYIRQAKEAMARQAAIPKTGSFADDAVYTPPSTPIQEPQDRHTAKVAEIWHGKPPEPETDKWWHNPELKNFQIPTVESFTDEVMQHHAGQEQSRGQREDVSNIPELVSAMDDEDQSPQPAIADVMRNPAAEARKAKAEVDKRTMFDPTEFGAGVPEQPDAPGRKLTIDDTDGDYDTLDAAKADRAKSVKANRDWEKKVNENPDENIASVASEHELDHEPFSKYANEMQAFEQDQWKQREAVKTGIRKAWGVHGGTLRDMENKGKDNSSLAATDNLKGNLTDAQIHEHLGSDEGSWSQNAWAMLREETPPKPGAHDREWLDNHAKAYKRLQSLHQPEPEDYPEPEDGAPFSRRSLAMSADRYFREFRHCQNQNSPQNWTIIDQWM